MTHNELIDHYGGPTAVSRMFDITPQAVSQWRSAGIPKAYHMVMQGRLLERQHGMTKSNLLKLMRTLSALESWGFSNNQRIPDYLHEQLCECVEALEREILTPGEWPEQKGPMP